jgi:hypothetical protein
MNGGFMKKLIVALFVTNLLVGCANSPYAISKMSAEEIKNIATKDLCRAYGNKFHNSKLVDQELKRRQEVQDEMSVAVKNGRVAVGMTKCEAIAAWGNPSHINATTSRYGSHEQWVYGLNQYRNYLYFEGNYLSTIQD